MRMSFLCLLTLIALMIWTTVLPVSATHHPAVDVIENLHTALLSVMKEGEKFGFRNRYNRLTPIITTSFDLPFIARTALGRYWDRVEANQKSKFVETFSRLSIATYAANFDNYSRERFKVVSEKALDNEQVQVRSQLIKSDGGEVSLDYILHRTDKQWRIINVIANGVSDLALKRADYTQFLKTKGFDALLDKLNEKIAQYSH